MTRKKKRQLSEIEFKRNSITPNESNLYKGDIYRVKVDLREKYAYC